MSTIFKFRRGTTTQVAAFTGAVGEVVIDTTKNTLVVQDGSTAGGFIIAKVSDITAALVTVASNLSTAIANFISRDSATGSAAMPSGTTAQRSVTGLVAGWFRFNTDLGKFEGYNGNAWGSVGGGATGGGSDTVFQENSRVVTTNYTLSSGKSAVVVGPLTVNTGITVTVPAGQRLVIL